MKGCQMPRPPAGIVEAAAGPFAGDPLLDVRREKRRIRIGAYGSIIAFVFINHLLIGMNWLQTGVTLGCCTAVATAAIEYAFARFIRLRKQGMYPSALAIKVGATHDFHQACDKSVRLLVELLAVERAILAWNNRHEGALTTVATHGIPSEDVPLATPLPWCQQAVRQAIEGRKVVVASARESRAWLPASNGRSRVVHVPLLSLDEFVGLLTLVGGRKASDLRDKTLLTTIGLAMGLTLDNLHHTVELRQIAIRDELTQLFNRRYFFEQLEKELKAARRSGRPVGVLILDVDKLKLINDTYGHGVGDKVLANLGKLLAKGVRAEDVPARIGGDEFAVLMRDTDKRGAFATAARLEKTLQARPMYKGAGIELTLTVSCGVAGYPWSGENPTEVIHRADANMYGTKAAHKGLVEATATARQSASAPGQRRAHTKMAKERPKRHPAPPVQPSPEVTTH